MKRIIIDLTDIEGWRGNHGGTQRVVYGIAKQFYLQPDKEFLVEFMVFSAKDDAFYQTSFEPIYDRVESQTNTTTNHNQSLTVSFKSRVKHSVLPYVPVKLRRNKQARALAKNTLRLGKGVAVRAKQKMQKSGHPLRRSSHGQKIVFTKNDIVLVLGKPWDTPTMEPALIKAKTQAGFSLVQVVYDLIISLYPHLHHPSLFKSYTQYLFEAIYGSDLLLPISKSTDKDIKKFAKSLNLPMPKSKVLRLADEITVQVDQEIKPDVRIADKFIACIGTIEIRKNHTLLYYAYKLAEQRGIELPQLVIVGSRGWLTNDFQYMVEHDPLIKDKIILLDNVNDQGLAWIYTNTLFSVYPSFYEGWGLPVAEALARGKLSIASNVSSIPEIAGDMIDYFVPYDAQTCLDLIVKYLDPETLKQKESYIQQKYRTTSWEDTFKQVNRAINELE